LERVLRAAAQVGLIRQEADGYAATMLSSVLAADHPSKIRYFMSTWCVRESVCSFGRVASVTAPIGMVCK
jgi:hypothetical protein